MKLTRTISLAMLLVIANQSFAQLPVTTGLELWLDATDAASVGGNVATPLHEVHADVRAHPAGPPEEAERVSEPCGPLVDAEDAAVEEDEGRARAVQVRPREGRQRLASECEGQLGEGRLVLVGRYVSHQGQILHQTA